jgi:hypothetical protein
MKSAPKHVNVKARTLKPDEIAKASKVVEDKSGATVSAHDS